MELTSNQEVVQTATATLTDAIPNSSYFANWIGYQAYQTFLSDPLNLQTDAEKLQTALDIVAAIEAGNFTLSDLFLAAQNKTGVVTDIGGEPNPTLTVLDDVEIGSLLGDTTVDSWTSASKTSTTTHFREYFTTVGKMRRDGYDENWNVTNEAPTDIQWNATDWTSGTDLPGSNAVLANLTTVDPDGDSEFTYSLLAGSSPNFAVSEDGIVTASTGLVNNTTYTLNVQVTDADGASYTETFNIITGTGGNNNPLPGGPDTARWS